MICELVNGARLSTGEQAQLIRDKCTRKWQIPHSEKTRISRGTILDDQKVRELERGTAMKQREVLFILILALLMVPLVANAQQH